MASSELRTQLCQHVVESKMQPPCWGLRHGRDRGRAPSISEPSQVLLDASDALCEFACFTHACTGRVRTMVGWWRMVRRTAPAVSRLHRLASTLDLSTFYTWSRVQECKSATVQQWNGRHQLHETTKCGPPSATAVEMVGCNRKYVKSVEFEGFFYNVVYRLTILEQLTLDLH